MAYFSTADLARALQANPDLELIGAPVEAAARAAQSEHDFQAAVMAECACRALADSRYELILAIPNGGARHPAVAAKLKAEGVKAGVPDLFLACPSRGYHGAFVELKAGRNQPSVAQTGWIAALSEQGYFVAVVHDSVEKVMDVLSWYLSEQEESCLPSTS